MTQLIASGNYCFKTPIFIVQVPRYFTYTRGPMVHNILYYACGVHRTTWLRHSRWNFHDNEAVRHVCNS